MQSLGLTISFATASAQRNGTVTAPYRCDVSILLIGYPLLRHRQLELKYFRYSRVLAYSLRYSDEYSSRKLLASRAPVKFILNLNLNLNRNCHSDRVVKFTNNEINISFIIYLQYLHSKNIKQQNNTLKIHDGR